MGNAAGEWLRESEYASKEFRAFIEFCYTHFGNQMDTLAQAFSTSREGEPMYEAYIASFKDDGKQDLEQNR